MPVTNVKFKMFAPITFPKLNADTLDKAEEIPTESSGIEVAKAMMMNAAVNSLILKKRDILLRDFTRRLPLTIKTKQAMIKYIRFDINIFFSFFLFLKDKDI